MIVRNEDRPGYKKTKIGWIPEDWEDIRLDEISSVKTGPFGAQLHKSDYVNNGTPIITVEHLGGNGLLHENLPLVSDKDKLRLKKYILHTDDIVFSRVGSVDRNSLVKKSEHGWLFSGRLLRIRLLNKNIAYSRFLSFYFHLNTFKHHMRSISVGGAMPSLNTVLLSGVHIPLPPLPEQKKIAEILSTWDEAIEKTRKLIEKKKRRKKALMQQLLTGKKRLPGFSKPWKRCKFMDVFEKVIRKNTGGNTIVLTISGSSGLVNQKEYFNKQVASKDLSGYYLLQFGEFAYNKSRSNGYPLGAIKRLKGYPVGVVSTLYFCFKLVHNKSDAEFYEHYFEGGQHNQELYTIAHEGARCHGLLNISAYDIMDTQLQIPDAEEQRDIADVLSSADSEIKTLDEKLSALTKQKSGLMQKLLTGEVRVITKYILDTCIFNWLLNGSISHADLPQDAHFVITHLQIDEINKTSDEDLRARLQLILTKLTHEVIPTETLVFDISRFNNAKMGNGSLYTTLVFELNKLSNRHENNIRDALIAEAAILNGYGLLTADRNLAKIARKNGCIVRFYTSTEKSEQ